MTFLIVDKVKGGHANFTGTSQAIFLHINRSLSPFVSFFVKKQRHR